MPAEQRLRDLGLELPPVSPPAASYVNAVRTGNFVFLSGTGPRTADGHVPLGKVGADVSVSEAAAHARQVGLNLLAVLRYQLEGLRRGYARSVAGVGSLPLGMTVEIEAIVEVE